MRNIAFGDGPPAANRKSPRTLRALFMVLAFGLNLLVVVGAGIYFLNDDDYRHILIWSVDYFLDSTLEIDGNFSVNFGNEVELSAETVRLKARDGSYDLSLGKLHVEQRFASYLGTGTFWINSLSMEDLHVEIKETEAEPGQEFDWQTFSLPFVVIEEIQLRNLSLAYTGLDQQRDSIELSHFSLDDTDNEGPVKVSAAGVMSEHTLQLDGTLGSLQQLRSMNPSYPIEFTLYSGAIDESAAGEQGKPVIKLNGSVGTTLSGASLVEATFDLAVAKLVPIFSKQINAKKLGHLQGNINIADVGGRWGIQKIQFAATNTDVYQLQVDGKVDSSGNFDLRSELGVPDPNEFGARFGIDLAGYAPFKGKGLVSGNKDKVSFEGKASIGRIESDTTLTANLAAGKPHIQGKLTIKELYLADIGIDQRLSVPLDAPLKAKPESSEQPGSEVPTPIAHTSVKAKSSTNEQLKPETSAPVVDASVTAGSDTSGHPKPTVSASTASDSPAIFDRKPLDFSGLQKYNLDLELSIDQITGADFSIDKLAGKLKLTDGRLRLSPMRVTFDGGTADLEFALDARKTPTVLLKVTADDLLLGKVIPHVQQEMQVQGGARLHIDITSKGRSAHELVSALSGDVSLGLENVILPKRYVDYISTDGQKPSAAGDAYTTLEIDGAVAIKFGSEAELTAETLHVRANDGSYDLSLGKLNLQQNLALYLETGDFSIQRLSMADMHVEIVETEAEEDDPSDLDWHEFDLQVDDLPLVIIEKMELSNLSLAYTTGEQQDTASLSSLVLDNDHSEEPLTVSAVGMLNERTLKLEGTLGTPAEPRGKNQIYPVDYSLSSGTVDAPSQQPIIKFNGSIDRTQPSGAVIKGRFDIAVSELVSIFDQQMTTDKLGHLQGDVFFSEVDGRWGIKKHNLASTGSDLYQLKLDGEVDNSGKFEMRSQFDVPDPAALGAQLGLDFTGYAAYKGTAVVTGNRAGFDYKGHWEIGRIENDTTLAISLVEGKPTIKGKFVIPDLYLPDIGINEPLVVPEDDPKKASPHIDEDAKPEAPVAVADASAKAEKPADSLIVFAREPLDFSGLQNFNLDLEILIDDIIGIDYTIDALEGRIKLTDGVLHISPMRLTFEGGTTDLDLLLDSRNTPSVTLKVTADDLVLGKMISDLQEEVPVTGKAHLNIDITSKGHSPHELASDLSGEVSFSLENARLPTIYVEFLSADVFGLFTRMVTFEDSYTNLNCVMTGFDIDQGVMTSNLLFADGPRLAVEGTATVDLGQETIDMELIPEQKKRFVSNLSAIKVTGPLADPDVETSSTQAVAATVGMAIVVPQIIIPVFLIEQLWKRVFSSDDDSGCTNFIAEHKAEQQEAAEEKAE